jgi:hypothetical protein
MGPRSVVRDAHERIVRCGLVIVLVSSETEDKFEDAMEVTASSPLLEIVLVFVRFNHIAAPHRKRGSQHHVSGCKILRSGGGSRKSAPR